MLGDLQILDTNFKVIARISSSIYFDYNYHTYLDTGAETLDFSVQSKDEFEQVLKERNYVLFERNGKFKIFQITGCKEEENYDNVIRKVQTEIAGLELINDYVREFKVEGNMTTILTAVLRDTTYQIGYVSPELDNIIVFIELTETTSVYTVLQDLIPKFNNAELEFEVKCIDSISGKYEFIVNFYANGERGNKTYKRFDYDFNTANMSRESDATELCSGLIGVGANGCTFKDIDWGDGDNDYPLAKPAGQDFLFDPEAHALLGGGEKYILRKYKSEATTPIDLLWDTYYKLQELKQIKYKYEVPITLTDEEFETIETGDTCYITNDKFNPPIQLEARINELELSDGGNKATFANYKEVKSNLKKNWTTKDMLEDLFDDLDKTGKLTEKDIQYILEQLKQLGLQSEEIERLIRQHNEDLENKNSDKDLRVTTIDGGLWIGDKRIYDIKKHKLDGINIEDTPPIEPGDGNNTKPYRVTANSLNIRKGPSTSYEILGTFNTGDKINVYSITDGWAKISYNSGIAYVSAKYITEDTNTYDPIPPGKGSKDYAEAVKYYAKFNLGTLANSSSLAKVMSPSNQYKIPTLVNYWSRKFGLDPSLVYCIIIAESSGSPYCATKTSAGGYGLMQCERAAYFNKKQTVKFLDGTTQSFTPSYSTMKPGSGGTTTIDGVVVDKNISNQVMFGCHEFRKSLERFQYNIFASLVGYNFGLYGCDLCICKYVAEKNGLAWKNAYGYKVQSKAVQELYFKELAKLTFDWANERKWYKKNKKAGTPNNVELYLRWYKSIDGQLPYTLNKNGVKMGYGAYKPTNSNISTNTSSSTPVYSTSTASVMTLAVATNTTTKYVNASSLNVRSGPGTSYSIVGAFSDGAKVDVISESNGWAKIVYGDSEAYVSAKYLVTYSNDGTDYTGKVATDVRKKITDMARLIVSDHVDKKIATYNQVPRTTRYEKPVRWSGTHYGMKNPIAYDCSSFVGCCYHNAGIDDLIGLSCYLGTLVDKATRQSGYKMWKVTNSSLNDALPGDIVMDANFKITSSNLTRANMIKEGKTHHTMIYLGNGKVAHASQWEYHPKAIKISNISYYVDKGSAFFLRPYQLAKIDEQSTPITPNPPSDPGDGTVPPTPTDPGKPIVTDPKYITVKGLEGANPRDYFSDTKLKETVTVNGITDNMPYPSEPPYVFTHFGVKSLGTDDTLYYKSLIRSIKTKYPRTPILIAKEYHVPNTYENYSEINSKIDTFNEEMEDFALDTKYVVMLDAPNELLSNGCLKSELTTDGYSCKDKDSTKEYFAAYKKAILNYNNNESTPVPNPPTETNKPVISGINDVVIRVSDTFNERDGITAYDKEDGDITAKIQIEGTVNTSIEGEYILTYSVTDNDNNTTTATRKITVLSNSKPIINGISDKEIQVGDVFDPMSGVTAHDTEDGDITNRIKVSGGVDNKTSGKYKLTYSVTDTHGNTTTMYRYITVNPGSTEAPPSGDDPEPPPTDEPKPPTPPEKKVTKSITMKGQEYYTYEVVHDMTMKLPSTVAKTFFSKLTFTTPKSTPKFSQSKIVYLTGDHCKNGALIVQPNHQYQIMVYTNPNTSQSKYAGSVAAYKIGDVEEKFRDFRGAKDIPVIAKTWIDNKSKFTYAHDTVTSYTNPDANKSKWKTSSGKYKVDCSTLAGLIMRGHTYSSSPYAKKTTKLGKNTKYSWAFEMPRTAADQAKYCVEHGWVLNGIDMTDFSNVPAGALIFYDRDNKVINRFMATSHVAVCVGKRNGVNSLIESTTDANGGIRYKAIKDNTPDKILFIALPQIF